MSNSIGSVVDIDKLPEQHIKVLKAIKKEGERHLEYFYSTMKHFKFPEKRMKTFDTKYYEDALPFIDKILKEKENN